MKSFLMYCSAATVALAVASIPAAAQQVAASASAAKPVPVAELVKRVDIPYEQFTLKNGLRVIVHTDRKAPIVAVVDLVQCRIEDGARRARPASRICSSI